jgi:hypothetical protein
MGSALYSCLTSFQHDTTAESRKMNSDLTAAKNADFRDQQELQDIDENSPNRFQVAIVEAEDEDTDNDYLTSSTPNQQYSYVYDSRYRSLGQLTREVPPRVEHYRDLSIQHQYRPTLEELHETIIPEKVQ